MLTARTENFLVGDHDLSNAIKRLQAYQEAGADVLFAPGLTRREDIAALIRAVDRPVNVLVGLNGPPLTLSELSKLGVTRVSVGSALARAAYAAVLRGGSEMLSTGTFEFSREAIPYSSICQYF